ncbi:MAG: CvpA family protein [Deltaproteobacteria bacterium]|nr:CvpA family protein [Deltaproteobacteria bacterium]
MNALDWFLIVVFLLCLLRGLFRGAVSQVFGIVGAVGGLLVAAHFHQPLAAQINRVFPAFAAAPAVSLVVLFLLAWFSIGMVGHWITSAIRKTGLGFPDRILGGGIGLLKALVLAVVVTMTLSLLLPSRSRLLERSVIVPHVQSVTRFLLEATPETVRKQLDDRKRQAERFLKDRKDGPGRGQERPDKEEKRI